MRLDKYLADCGLGSRSQVKALIRKGKITVNGRRDAASDTQVDPKADIICLDGKRLQYEAVVWLMLNKPCGVVTASRDKKERTVMDLIDRQSYARRDLNPVGRLDKDTEGLLLITDDGQRAHHLLSPSHHVEKEYEAMIEGQVTEQMRQSFAEGMMIGDEKKTLPASLELIRQDQDEALVRIILQEGRYHQVKRMTAAVGSRVLSLKRIRMGKIVLDKGLAPGEYRCLTGEETELLYEI